MDKGLIDLEDYCILKVSGKDARRYLNGILTNDIETLKSDSGCYSCLCTPKGRILADLFCYVFAKGSENEFKIVLLKELKQKVLNIFEKYMIAQDVVLKDLSKEWSGVGVFGKEAGSFLRTHFSFLPQGELGHHEGHALWLIYKNLWGYPCYEIWVKSNPESSRAQSERDLLIEKLSLPMVNSETQEILRIESMTPKYAVDMDENTFPQEANLYHALNFQKGCYVGQETIARLEHLGHVNKKLCLLKTNKEVKVNSNIFGEEGEEIGFVTSRCFSYKYKSYVALGYVRTSYTQIGKVVRFEDSQGTILK